MEEGVEDELQESFMEEGNNPLMFNNVSKVLFMIKMQTLN